MKKYILAVVIGVPVIVLAVGIFLFIDYERHLQRPMSINTRETLLVRPGTSLRAIAEELVQRGWIPQPHYLVIDGRRRGLANSIKTGEYAVQPGTTPREFLSLIVSGKVIQYSLTIPEGWTFRQILVAIRGDDNLEKTIITAGTILDVMQELGYPGQHPEGRFFPDTYLFPAGTTDVQFLRRAYETMEQVMNEEWDHRATGLPYTEPYQALIMASIIEKETAVADERYKIAGVFVRRLEQGIRLQTDPTVIYALGESFDGDITSRDLGYDSPYNTYRYAGLPPTPIAAPGRESIRAALQPEDGTALYFVSMGDGRHHFSDTLEEHNQAVKKYQLKKQ